MATNKLGQVKELLALTVLGLLSSLSASFLLKEASDSFISRESNIIIRAYFYFSHATHQPLNAGLLKKPNPLQRSWSQRSIAVKLAANTAIDGCYTS
ncbi:MAG: hypothetical protein ACKOZW_11565 [Cyanobium sp.]